MAVTGFNTTTLSEALDKDTSNFTVGSTTNISVGDNLVIRGEQCRVQEIPVSGRVKVLRGIEGTEARSHPSGHRLFIIANPEDTKRNTRGQLAMVGASGNYPDYLFPGQRANDGAGREYVLVQVTTAMFSGATVSISMDGLFTAGKLLATSQGPVGVLVEEVTSNQYAWAQIYGENSYAQEIGDSAATSSYFAIASSASTPDVGLSAVAFTSTEQPYIYGMFITGAATTATTSASSATGVAVPVFLNYPYVRGTFRAVQTS